MGALKTRLNRFKSEKKLLNSKDLLGSLSFLQQTIDGYATNVAFTPDSAMHEIKGFTEQNDKLKKNASEIKDAVNPKINDIIYTIERSFIITYNKGHALLDDSISHLDTESGRNKFKQVSKLFEAKIQTVIDTLEIATPIVNSARGKIEENARITGKIVTDANNSKSIYKSEIIELNNKIITCEKTITDTIKTLAYLEDAENGALLGLSISAGFGLVGLLLFGIKYGIDLAKARGDIAEHTIILNQAQDNVKDYKTRLDRLNQLMETINSVFSIMTKINSASVSLARDLLSIRESWDSLKNLLTIINREMKQISSVDEEDLAAIKEIYIDPLKDYVKTLKETINIRSQKIDGDNFKIDIDPKLKKQLSYFPTNSNGFITLPSNLAWSLCKAESIF